MDTPNVSAISRYPPSVVATVTVAAAASIYFIHSCVSRSQLSSNTSLHRSNAVRRSHASSRRPELRDVGTLGETVDGHEQTQSSDQNDDNEAIVVLGAEGEGLQGDATAANAAETENSIDNSTEYQSSPQSGTRLQELVYAIAKNASEQEGIVHRGISCDKCHKLPIVGVRYHCVNCPDFDLCEDCEATDCHLKTHVFYKVKIPSPWAGKSPLPVWYPGDPTRMPHTLENGTFKNSLATKTGFTLNKIDGLYQQFSCMANVKTSKTPGMGIDRIAFDHCFIGQTMTERPSTPNIVHERLFHFYDENNDGVVDFEEFVVGTSLVHSKDKTKREKRIFRGLDLDNDKFISRKDCLRMFRAFYSLNKDMMLGYIRVEREGENGDLARVRQDPRHHLAHGRPLASFFDDTPSFISREVDITKPRNIVGEDAESGQGVSITLGPEPTINHDLMSLEQVSEKNWLSLWTVFNDEIFRLCVGKQMKWLRNGFHARLFDPKLRSDGRNLVEDEDNQLWVADATHYGKTAYLRLEPSDLEKAQEVEAEQSEKTFYEAAHNAARTRLCFTNIWQAIGDAGQERLRERRVRDKFFLKDSNDTFPAGNHSNGPKFHTLDQPLRNEDMDKLSIPASTPTKTDDKSVGSSHVEQPRQFVGGTAAAHTIYKVIEEALNELLDPLFSPAERLALGIDATQTQREKHAFQINTCLKDLRSVLNAKVPDAKTLSEPCKTEEAREKAIRNFVTKLTSRDLFDNEETLIAGYTAWSSLYAHFQYTDSTQAEEHFMNWLFEIEATMSLEDNPDISPSKALESSNFHKILDPFGAATTAGEAYDLHKPPAQSKEPNVESTEAEHERNDESDCDKLDSKDLFPLVAIEAVARNSKIKNGVGLLDFAEFMRKLELTEENGDKLLQWIGNWVDLIMF